jgi:hypothetical protein
VEEFCFITDNTYTSIEVCHMVHSPYERVSNYLSFEANIIFPLAYIIYLFKSITCQCFIILPTFSSSGKNWYELSFLTCICHILLYLFANLVVRKKNDMWNLRLVSKMKNCDAESIYNTSSHFHFVCLPVGIFLVLVLTKVWRRC